MDKDVALVLSSGGPRGFAYIGAIEELESRGYNITSVAGCSIGSLVGGVYAAGGLDGFKEWLFNLDNTKLISLLDVSISKSYLVKGEKVIEAIKEGCSRGQHRGSPDSLPCRGHRSLYRRGGCVQQGPAV